MSRHTDGSFIVTYSQATKTIEEIFTNEMFSFEHTERTVNKRGTNVTECTYTLKDKLIETDTYTFEFVEGYEYFYNTGWRQNEMSVRWEKKNDYRGNLGNVQNTRQLELYLAEKMPNKQRRIDYGIILAILEQTDHILSAEANKAWIDSIKKQIEPFKKEAVYRALKERLAKKIQQKMENLTSEIVSCLG